MPLRNLVWLLVIPGLVGLGLAICYSAPVPDKQYQRIRQLVEVIAEVDANFVRELSDDEWKQFIEDMINGGLEKLDPHSQYFNEEQLKRFESDNEGGYGGVGIQLGGIDEKTKFLRVGFPMPGTPAYDAGVAAGDLILKVDDTPTSEIPATELRNRIAGEVGTKVTLLLRREGHNPPEFPVTLTRARIAVHPVTGASRRPDDPTKWNWFVDDKNKIGYIHIAQFSELTAKEVKAAVEEIEAAGGRGLIIDLRDDPGGLLSQAVEVADLFLTEGKIVTTVDRRGGSKTSSAKDKGTLFLPADQKPIVVLVNGHSASASEIVAAALQDNGRAVVVGERTYGKGSVQTPFRLGPDQKTAVKLTTQTWWRPNGKNMDRKSAPKDRPDEWGVTPDPGMAVPFSDVDYVRYRIEKEQQKFTPGRPDMIAPRPPPPVVAPKGPDGKPLWDDTKPFEDKQLIRAEEQIRKKLQGVGAGPAVPKPPPERQPV